MVNPKPNWCLRSKLSAACRSKYLQLGLEALPLQLPVGQLTCLLDVLALLLKLTHDSPLIR